MPYDEDDYGGRGEEGDNDGEPILRIRGMPWSATEKDVVKFFGDIPIRGGPSGVSMVLSREGRASGEAYIELENADDLERAMKKHHQHMGARYIELFKSSRSEMDWTLKAQSRGGGGGGMGGGSEDSGSEAVVRLRGLPFGCTKDDIAQFFDGMEILPNGIYLVTEYNGRATGDAYVQFADSDYAERALDKHKEKIGHRYVEIFRSSMYDLRQAMDGGGGGRSRGGGSRGGGGYGGGGGRSAPYDSSQRYGGSNRYDGGRGGGGRGGGGGGFRSGGGRDGGGGGGYRSNDRDGGYGSGGRGGGRGGGGGGFRGGRSRGGRGGW